MKKLVLFCLMAAIAAGTDILSAQTSSKTAPRFKRNLELKSARMNGEDVAVVQRKLLELGYAEVGEADGWLGPMTEQAIIRFRRRNGPSEGKIVDEEVWQLLFSTFYQPVRGERPKNEARAIVASRGLLLGSLQSGGRLWIGPEETAMRIDSGTVAVKCQTDEGKWIPANGTVVWGGNGLGFPVTGEDNYRLAVQAAFEPVPRPVIELGSLPQNATKAVNLLKGNMGWSKVDVAEAFCADWDGDGGLDYIAAIDAEDGTVSAVMLFLARPSGIFFPVILAATESSVPSEAGRMIHCGIEGILDADGDGRFEAVISTALVDGWICQLIKEFGTEATVLCSGGTGE